MPAREYNDTTFKEIDHEIISTAILALLLVLSTG